MLRCRLKLSIKKLYIPVIIYNGVYLTKLHTKVVHCNWWNLHWSQKADEFSQTTSTRAQELLDRRSYSDQHNGKEIPFLTNRKANAWYNFVGSGKGPPSAMKNIWPYNSNLRHAKTEWIYLVYLTTWFSSSSFGFKIVIMQIKYF